MPGLHGVRDPALIPASVCPSYARAIVISRDKRLEKRAANHMRAFEKIADQQKRVRVEADAQKLD